MIGSVIRRLFGYGFEVSADALIIRGIPALWNILKEFHKNLPDEKKKEISDVLVKIVKGGRTRGDELSFYTSLVELEGISARNKLLFMRKHSELILPELFVQNWANKTPDEIKELRRKQKLAEGLVLLMAEDESANNPNPVQRFQCAKEVWQGIFWDINNFPNDDAKLQQLEKQILYFGKNNQDSMRLSEIVERSEPFLGSVWNQIDSGVSRLGDGISAFVRSAERYAYEERIARANDRAIRRRQNPLNWLNPVLFFQWFNDLR